MTLLSGTFLVLHATLHSLMFSGVIKLTVLTYKFLAL